MIANTDDNIRKAEATLDNLSGDDRAQVEAKNERRRESIDALVQKYRMKILFISQQSHPVI